MHDDLDLRVIERHHDADPAFHDALRTQLAAILDSSDAAPTNTATDTDLTEAATIDLAAERLARREHTRRGLVVGAAALVGVAAAIAGIVLVTSGGSTISPTDDSVTTPTDFVSAPTTAPTAPGPTTPTELFPDLPAGSSAELPTSPVATATAIAKVWTGSQLIVWSDVDDPAGAVFDVATRSWRRIPMAPIDAIWLPGAVWTGTEMIVWGRSPLEAAVVTTSGAAYNPATDTWRRLPDAPIAATPYPGMVWTGHEVVALGGAAYDPATNTWRQLATPAGGAQPDPDDGPPVWTGTHVLVTLRHGPENDPSYVLARYDLAADTWSLDSGADYTTLVGVPDADGVSHRVVAIPHDFGAPVALLDSAGDRIGTFPAVPDGGDDPGPGPSIRAHGLWVGDEVVLWIDRGERQLFPDPAQVWALNPAARTWRRLVDDGDTVRLSDVQFAVNDVVVGEATVTDPASETEHTILYASRLPSPGTS